ncbi:MAG: tetratricopeptide repeat protein [Bdellovibrio sp.]
MRASQKGEFEKAILDFEKVMVREPSSALAVKAARQSARVCYIHLKNFEKAAYFYRELVLNSPDADERLNAQKQIALIYTENISKPDVAVRELSKLLSMLKQPQERFLYRLALARSSYHLKNMTQSLLEIDELMREKTSGSDEFSLWVLKGNVHLAQKDLTKSAQAFEKAMQMDASRAVRENVAIQLAVAFEEMKDFEKAIRVLKNMKPYHPQPDYIEIRIRRLLERQRSQPGAMGFRK